MRRTARLTCASLLAVAVLATSAAWAVLPGEYTAFSLQTAQRLAEQAGGRGDRLEDASPEVYTLAGITRLIAAVVDEETGDCILIGVADPTRSELLLDDVVLALRSAYVHGMTPPGVTIEPQGEMPSSRPMEVIYFAGIENTHFGEVCFRCDYILKKIALEIESARPPSVPSYRELAVRRFEVMPLGGNVNILSRFWFYPAGARIHIGDAAVLLDGCTMGVLTERLPQPGSPATGQTDPAADDFARLVTAYYDELSNRHPVYRDLKSLTEVVAVAKGLTRLREQPEIRWWLTSYTPKRVETPKEVPGLKATPHRKGAYELQIHGGVRLFTLPVRSSATRASDLGATALRSRPSPGQALSWTFRVSTLSAGTDRLTANPTEEKAADLLMQALYLQETREYEQALQTVDEALRVCPGMGEAEHARAMILFDSGFRALNLDRLRQALEALQSCAAGNPNYADVHLHLGATMTALGRHEEAIPELEQAVTLAPHFAAARFALAKARYGARDYSGASRELQAYLAGETEEELVAEAERMLRAITSGQTPDKARATRFKQYRSREVGVSLDIPEEWDVLSPDDMKRLGQAIPMLAQVEHAVAFANPDDPDQNLIVGCISPGPIPTLSQSDMRQLIDMFGTQLRAMLPAGTQATVEQGSLCGLQGVRLTIDLDRLGRRMHSEAYMLIGSRRVYVVASAAPTDYFGSRHRPILERMLGSLKLGDGI
jgi:tetratricopeptide (TPR) repeat protein